MRQREPAICLRATDFSETSQVVHFLTRGCGVVRLIAKGSKRPKSKSGGAIDLLSEGDLVFTTRLSDTLGILIEFTETACHGPLRKDAAALNVALYAIELLGNMLADADPHREVFDLLHNTLARLSRGGGGTSAVLAYFQWRLLRHVGLLGELGDCVSCGSRVVGRSRGVAGEIYFCSAQGGLLCAACETGVADAEKFRIDGATTAGLKALTAAEKGSKVLLPEKQAHAVNRLLAYHIGQQLGKPLKMARYAIT